MDETGSDNASLSSSESSSDDVEEDEEELSHSFNQQSSTPLHFERSSDVISPSLSIANVFFVSARRLAKADTSSSMRCCGMGGLLSGRAGDE